ncbi:hypothetical protein Tco_1016492 [Tanacetum coccineum]|uniref:Retrovirus-related Pol polyprotein from transposon TNT 1-94-like beta-barrel domain-containing protein n=1 Tax=Tanacetum coccineum TaxID=301880 RepID=A0ABQ5FNT7_9ASTR
MSLESLEVMLKTHEKNEYAWGDKYEQMEYDLKIRDLKLEEKQKELDQVLKERDDFKVKLEKWTNASVLQNEVLNKQRYLSDKSCIGFGVESSSGMESDNSSGDETLTDHLYENFKREKAYKAVPPPTGTIIPPRANVSFTGIDELAIRNKVVNQEKTKTSQSAIDRNKVIIEDWVDSDDEETVLNSSETQKKTVLNSENSETSFKNRSPSSQNSVGQGSRKKGLGNNGGKLCFVCYSPNHLIKDCNLHERNFKQTQTHKPKRMQGSRDTRPVWNNINRVNHSNFSGNSRYPHQKRSFIPSAVLTREGLKSTARPKYCNCSFSLRPKMTQTVPSKRTANVFYQGTARPRVPQAVLSRSTGRPYYPRMDNRRPSISSYSPSSRSSTTRTPYRTQRPKKIVKSIWVKKGSTVESQAVLPQNVSIKRSAMITSKQTWRQNRGYLDSVNRDNGSYILKQFEYGNPEEDLKDYAIIDSGCSGTTFKGRIACKVWTLKEDLMLFLRGVAREDLELKGGDGGACKILGRLLGDVIENSLYRRHCVVMISFLVTPRVSALAGCDIDSACDKLVAVIPKNKDKRVRFTDPVTSSGNTNTKTASSSNLVSNKCMLSSTGVKLSTIASGSQSSGNTKKDKIQRTPRTAIVQHSKLNVNSEPLCVKCNGCMLSDNHDLCVLDFINDVNARTKSKSVKKSSKRKVWKPTRKVITTTAKVPLRKPNALESDTPKPVVVQIILWYLDSGCSKHMTRDCSQLTNFVNKFLGTVKFGNDHVVKILGYGDYYIWNVTISRVYYVEGLGHNLFSVGQFCDSNLEVAFCQHTCFIHNLKGVDLLTGSRGNNLYTMSLGDMMASSPICLLSKASKTKSWLWH